MGGEGRGGGGGGKKRGILKHNLFLSKGEDEGKFEGRAGRKGEIVRRIQQHYSSFFPPYSIGERKGRGEGEGGGEEGRKTPSKFLLRNRSGKREGEGTRGGEKKGGKGEEPSPSRSFITYQYHRGEGEN